MPLAAAFTFMVENWIIEGSLYVSLMVEGIAAMVVAYAAVEAVVRGFMAVGKHTGSNSAETAHNVKEDIRLRLGRWLAVALELLLGADILRTAVAPSWNEIGKLAAIAAIRTALNFFLQREIDSAQTRREQSESNGRQTSG